MENIPLHYRQYVDNVFVLLEPSDHLKRSQKYLNFCHVNMIFFVETERTNKVSFMNVNVIREQGKFTKFHIKRDIRVFKS